MTATGASRDDGNAGSGGHSDVDWGGLVPVVAGMTSSKTSSGVLTTVALLRPTIEEQPVARSGVIQKEKKS
jgi:hypothetical protein